MAGLSKRIMISIPQEVLDALRQLADSIGPEASMADAARRAIVEGLKLSCHLPQDYRQPRKWARKRGRVLAALDPEHENEEWHGKGE